MDKGGGVLAGGVKSSIILQAAMAAFLTALVRGAASGWLKRRAMKPDHIRNKGFITDRKIRNADKALVILGATWFMIMTGVVIWVAVTGR